mmetsp:Transcript_37917/g.72915  ORF Transcript_37917/g.72915 Transcript_37917/m.72915 type:complete len:208 (-) Transcript_37917:72-695(-)
MALKASAIWKWATPAAAKMSPRGTGHVKSLHAPNQPLGSTLSTPERRPTHTYDPRRRDAEIAPKISFCSSGDFAETRIDGSGLGTSNGSFETTALLVSTSAVGNGEEADDDDIDDDEDDDDDDNGVLGIVAVFSSFFFTFADSPPSLPPSEMLPAPREGRESRAVTAAAPAATMPAMGMTAGNRKPPSALLMVFFLEGGFLSEMPVA